MPLQNLSRRGALGGLVISVAGAIAGFAVAKNSDAAKKKGTGVGANSYGAGATAGGKLLVSSSKIPAGGGVILTGAKVVVTTGSDGHVHAFSAVCTHQGCLVTSVSDGAIDCPCHGSRFDATSGAVLAGPAPSPLPTITVTVRNGGVYTA